MTPAYQASSRRGCGPGAVRFSRGIGSQPTLPEPATLDRIREHLAYVIANGTPAERKATVEQLIAEIRLTEDDQVIPVFRIPGPDDTAGTTTEAAEPETVRAMPHLVGRAGLEPATEGL